MQATEERAEANAPTKIQLNNRTSKRSVGIRTQRDLSALRSIHQVLAIGPRAFRRRKTGRNPHFQAWLQETAIQRHLHGMRTAWLADRLAEKEEAQLAMTFQLLADGGYRNVLSVAKASREELLAVKGIGRVRLRKAHDYLSEHQVPLSWEI